MDLKVDDTLPLHGSLELNNRYSVNTTPLRLDVGASYDNLWQLNHTIGGSVQTLAARPEPGSGILRLLRGAGPGVVGNVSFVVQGVKQQSNVNTLGDVAVAGRGDVEGLRAIITLAGTNGFLPFADPRLRP